MKLLLFLALWSSVSFALINPILPGWNPDPTILRVGQDYFIATSTFEYFPGHPIYHSKDLVTWTLNGHALNRPSQLILFGTPSDAGLWAPTLRYHDGTFYLLSTARYVYTAELRLFPRSFYVKTTDIYSNNWSDPVYFDALGYDGDIFWDANGDVYTTWSGINNAIDKIYGIWQNKIDLATGNSLTEANLIFKGTLPNNSSARPEGPHVYHINGTYYLLIAEGGTGVEHRATIQRGPSPSGPWENNPHNPILFNGADLNNSVQNTGHADMVEGPDGRWWGVALGVRPQNHNFDHVQLGRETFLFPITWEDGWPVFNNRQPITEKLDTVLRNKSPLTPYSNSFTSHALDSSFYFIRTPYKPFHSLTARPGYLRLFANSYVVGDRDNPALLLRKQTSYSEEFETQLEFSPKSNLTEAGVSVFYGDSLHNEIGIIGDSNGSKSRWIVVRTANATATSTIFLPLKTASGPVKLKVVALPASYTFGYSEGADTTFESPVSIDASALTVPPAGGFFFKGASFGIYNTGNGKPSLAPADFAYWRQTPTSG